MKSRQSTTLPLSLAVLAAAVLCGLPACQTTSTAKADRFAQADADKDGRLSRAECSDYVISELFDSRDANHDHQLTWEEWNVAGAPVSRKKFDAYDANRDGVISREEALAHGRKYGVFKNAFREADTNHDGYLTREEARAYYASKEGPVN